MAITASAVTPDKSLEEFRVEFNKLIQDFDGVASGNSFAQSIIFEGATADAFETTLLAIDPTADNTISLPDVTGTVITTGNSNAGTTTSSSGDADFILVDDGGVLKKITPANLGIGGSAGSVAADDVQVGNDAVLITTSSGNITIDAAANDTDIIFKGTDNTADITMLTLDGSDAGKAIFNGAISATTITLTADGGVLLPDGGNIGSASSTAAMQIASTGIVTFVDDILIKDGGTIGVASSTSAITIASTGIVTLVDDLLLKDACTIGTATTAGAIAIAADGKVDLATAAATVNSAVIKTVGKESIWVPAAAMYPSTTNGCAALAQVETTALRPDLKCLDFDPSSDEFAQFSVAFPKSWNEGTITFQPFWTVTGTNTGTVAWQLGGIAASSDDSINTAFGTLVATTALAHSGTSNDLMVSVESGNVTIGGSPAVGDCCFFQINRDVSADGQTGDARLLGIKLLFTTDAATDA